MSQEDIAQIRSYIEDIRSYISGGGDRCVYGQWETFQYVLNSQDTNGWAATTTIGSDVFQDLKKRVDNLNQYMYSTLDYCYALEAFVDAQEQINLGNY